jgi:hypothetical protein
MLVLLLVIVYNTSKLTHVFGSKVLVLVLVSYKLTLTHPSNVVIISKRKKRGRDKIKSTGNRKRFPRRSMSKLLLVNG